ncbi:MAG: hypothetical protein M1296_02065 [Chloroflexi bacterium]|nr:hypothetical protein [Chloroflexota bacterium]
MEVIYAFRRSTLALQITPPFHSPRTEALAPWLEEVRQVGFEGLEPGLDATTGPAWRDAALSLRHTLEVERYHCVAVRVSGKSSQPACAVEDYLTR